MRAIAALLILIAGALVGADEPAAASDRWTRVLMEPAGRLWNPLPPGSRIALRPLDADESGLPDGLLREIEQALVAALLATAPSGGGVASRRDLGSAWEEAESFSGTSARRLLADAAVDAVAVTRVAERGAQVVLSAVLLAVREGEIGDVLATLPPTGLAVDVGQFGLVGAEAGARRLGVALADGLRAAADPTTAFAVRIVRTGERSPVADWFAGLVTDHLTRRLAQTPLYVARSLRRMGETATPRTVRLELEVWDGGDRADLRGRAVMETETAAVSASATARIALASIPPAFRPLTRDGGRVGRGLFQAVGGYVPRDPTDRREVLFAARVMARAALVDERTGDGTGRLDGEAGRDVAAAMARLERAIPHEEIWRDAPGRDTGAEQRLRARVRPVGGAGAPRLEAAVERSVYRIGDPLSARVLVRGGRAYVAAFVWQADDTVVRIAPHGGAVRRLEPDIRIDLPAPRDPSISPAPMPGSLETVEAIIVVASAVPFEATVLAPPVRATPGQSIAGAAEMSAFLDALADLDLTWTSLAVLPYRVRSGD